MKIQLEDIIIESKGSNLLEISEPCAKHNNYFVKCRSSVPIKCYYIIADNKLEHISVDHL